MDEMNFEEMRNQFAILKDQLNKEEIVSEQGLRETMKAKTCGISAVKRAAYKNAIFCLIIYPFLYFTHMFSLSFAVATCLMMVFCVVATWYTHKPVEQLNFMQDDFATVARVMARFKKQYIYGLLFVTPALIIPWLCWACLELAWKYSPKGISPLWTCAFLIAGAAIGSVIGYHYHRLAVNAAQDILDEINN